MEGTLAAKILFRSSHSVLPTPIIVKKEESYPQKINIPKLGVASKVEAVGLGTDGEMAMPENPETVAWYKLGNKLGEKGNVVIAGHLDSKTGPAIFYRLPELGIGEEIIVADQNNKEFHFVVVKKETYDEDKFPVGEVFGESDKPRLNLITCRGRFDRTTKRYTKRIVVYTELKERKTSSAADEKKP